MRSTLLLLAVISLAACHSDDTSPLAELHRAFHGETSPAIPILSVGELRASQRYFKEKLGFELMWEDGDPADFAAVRRGDAVFFLCQRCQGTPGSWSFIFVKDVDKLYSELKERGATVKSAPETKPWKLREMHVADADGNIIRFASGTDHD